jgi:hypothetical protein
MGSGTSDMPARTLRARAADAYKARRASPRNRSHGLALALGLTGLAASVLIALFGR